MSVAEDQVFEDQIERMKQKNQKILERFQASEEDRKHAETTGNAINKNQNVQIRMRNDDQTKRRKKSNPPPVRPKSFHDGSYNAENGYVSYNHHNDYRHLGKFNKTNNKMIDDNVAYQDYFHFQQTHRTKLDQSHYNNKPTVHHNNSHSYVEDSYNYNQSYRNYHRSTSQKATTSPRFHQNNYQKVMDPSVYKLDNNKPIDKEPQQRTNHFNSRNNTRTKLTNVSNQNVDPVVEKKPIAKPQKTVLDDEYIDDTLEDLEQYRLKVDMEDFIVIDPESPNPILAMPLTPWTNDAILTELRSQHNAGDTKPNGSSEEFSTNLLNNVNERAKDYLNLVDQANIDHLANIDLSMNDAERLTALSDYVPLQDNIEPTTHS